MVEILRLPMMLYTLLEMKPILFDSLGLIQVLLLTDTPFILSGCKCRIFIIFSLKAPKDLMDKLKSSIEEGSLSHRHQ